MRGYTENFKFKKVAFYGPAGCGKDFTARAFTELLFHNKNDSDVLKDNFYHFSFAGHLKKMIMNIFNLTEDMVNSEYSKNNTWVNLYTMSVEPETESESNKHEFPVNTYDVKNGFLKCPMNAKDLFNLLLVNLRPESENLNGISTMMSKFHCEYIITVRELLVYFGTYIMRNFLSTKIWVYSAFNDPEYIEAKHKNLLIINSDLRFPSEYERLKKEGYCFIKIIPDWQKYEKSNGKIEKINNIAESFYDRFNPDYEFHNYNCNSNLNEIEREAYWKSLCLLGFFIVDGIKYEDLSLEYRKEFDLQNLNSNYMKIFNDWIEQIKTENPLT